MSKQTVAIRGTVYDKVTGLPIRSTDNGSRTNFSHATSVHTRTQRSQTLSRKHVKQRQKAPLVRKITIETTSQPKSRPVRSPLISKYAPHPVSQPHSQQKNDITPAAVHPVAAKAAAKQTQAKRQARPTSNNISHTNSQPVKREIKPSAILKAEATSAALSDAPSHTRTRHKEKHVQRNRKQLFGRALSFASSGAALLLIAGYFTYVNMPNLSVRVAAVQSGVDASYPSYRPSGYSLSGPVAYDNGEVRMAFNANGTNQEFTLTQSKSGWDSSAVRENYVAPKAGENYTTTTSGGLTVYSWDGDAAWVSNGILYTVEGNAPLSPDQVRRMAASL